MRTGNPKWYSSRNFSTDSGELGLGSGVSSASAAMTFPTFLLGSGLARSRVIVGEGMPGVLPSCVKLQPTTRPMLSR